MGDPRAMAWRWIEHPRAVTVVLTALRRQHFGTWTTCYSACMSVNVSVRLEKRLAERLRIRARAAGESLSDRLRRYAEEGTRRDEHPLVTFRDGPAGRRAGLVGGPDVWEVAMWVDDLAAQGETAGVLAAEMGLPQSLIDAALQYRAAYPDEISARIDLHRSESSALAESAGTSST
jgi:hypothetical protein